MDRFLLERRLAQADSQVSLVARNIMRHRQRTAELARDGHAMENIAARLLAHYEHIRAVHFATVIGCSRN